MENFKQWSQLIMCGKIKPNEKIVLMVILNCNNMAWPFIAHTEIMKQSGLKETAVKEAIKSLRKMGLITKVKTDTNNMNNYIASGVNLTSLITSGSDFDPLNTTETTSGSQNNPQVGRKTPVSGSLNACNNNINKKDSVKRVKENIKEKRESNEIINGKLNRKDEVKEEHSNNNMEFKKNGIELTQNSQTAVQSKDWTKETKEEKTHSSSAGTTKVVQIGDTRYAVETANTDDSSIWDSFPGGTASREKKNIHQITTTEDRKGNTQSNASLHNENEDNPMDCGGMSIDDLENMFNGGNPTPTQPISKGGSQTTSKAKSNEGGGGHKFTPRKEWELFMKNISTKVDNNILPTHDEMNIIMEGAKDKYRVIDTLKVIYKMIFFRLKINGYGLLLSTCGDTLDNNKEAYTQKQYDFAWDTYDQCADQFAIFVLENPTFNN